MTSGTRPSVRGTAFALIGLAVGGLLVAAPALSATPSRGSTTELIFLAAFAVAAGLWLSFVTPDRSGALVIINPAVCYSFALMLSWGVVAAIGAHLASVAVLSWRWRLSPQRIALQIVQFAGAYLVSFGVIRVDGSPGPRGREWTSLHDSGVVAAAAVAWLVTYLALAYLFTAYEEHRMRRVLPRPSGNALLFNAALVVLSPVVAVTGEVSVALSALLLLPLYAVQRMARLSIERERADRLDQLTLLPNRTALRERFERSAGTGPSEERLVLLLLNLDRFKYINDSLGYELGDELLISVTQRLRGTLTGGETLARLGADEFAVVMRVPDLKTATTVASRMVDTVREPLRLSGLLMEVTASAGLAARDNPDDDFVAVLRHADSAMREAKRRGNNVAVFHDQPGDTSVASLQLLADFRAALTTVDDDSVVMHYQPQLSLATGEVDSVEALLRWTHPVHGPIDPTTILGLAEQTTVMNVLTYRVIDDVTDQIARWREQGLVLRVAINISARDLYSEDLVSRLEHRLAHHQVPAHLFQVEVTESALTTDPTRARATLRQIADIGIDISLDDFGTGFSSLQQIRGTPLAEIKIDQTFVRGMTDSRDDAAIVATTINLAHALGLRAVAEGVENEVIMSQLVDRGCELAQGWHISRPLPADRLPSFIAGLRRPDAPPPSPGNRPNEAPPAS